MPGAGARRVPLSPRFLATRDKPGLRLSRIRFHEEGCGITFGAYISGRTTSLSASGLVALRGSLFITASLFLLLTAGARSSAEISCYRGSENTSWLTPFSSHSGVSRLFVNKDNSTGHNGPLVPRLSHDNLYPVTTWVLPNTDVRGSLDSRSNTVSLIFRSRRDRAILFVVGVGASG